MSTRPPLGQRLVAAVLTLSAVALAATMLYWAFWPYNLVTTGGEPVLTGPSEIPVGGTLTWERDAEFCNYGVDTTITRSAELLGEDGVPLAGFEIPSVTFYVAGYDDAGLPYCMGPPIKSSVVIPQYVPPGTYRLRLETTYQPNPLFPRSLTSYSPVFTVVPAGGS